MVLPFRDGLAERPAVRRVRRVGPAGARTWGRVARVPDVRQPYLPAYESEVRASSSW